MKKDLNTEERILKAAEEVFQHKGFEGARMREIADKASINKGLLHYYFKTKNKLFQVIFTKALGKTLLKVQEIMSSEAPLLDKIDQFVDNYLSLLMNNPHLPKFVINELNRDPEAFVASILSKQHVKPKLESYFRSVEQAIKNQEIKPVDPKQLLINIIALSVFPFIGRPMLQGILGIDNSEFKQIILDRKDMIKTFIKDAISKPKKGNL